MLLNRRVFFKLIAVLGCPLSARALAAAAEVPEGRGPLRALAPFLDTLLPEDVTPSASQLGVDKALIEQARRDRGLGAMLVSACNWLDSAARKGGAEDFAALDETGREAVVRTALDGPERSLGGRYFSVIREEAFHHYYAHPDSWRGLGFRGPPQYEGFRDHAEPPQEVRS